MDRRDDTFAMPFRSPGRLGDLEREAAELRLMIKTLKRELQKAEARHAETEEAYVKTVSNLVQTTQENMLLRHECERLRQRTQQPEAAREPYASVVFALRLTPAEVAAVRKAIARLHHPDVGGDVERMQAWNVALDTLLEQ